MTNDTIYEVTIQGIRPLIMHNGRLADPLDEHKKRLAVATNQKKKGDADHIRVARTEFEGGLYFDETLGPYLPPDNLQAVIERGAMRRKLGPIFKAHVSVDPPLEAPGFRLDYKGPRDVEGLWQDRAFVLMKGVRVQRNRVIRCRARFPTGWRCAFRVEVMADGVTKEQLQQAIEDAGLYTGIGDWRPRYGRFVVESVRAI